jgi:hypothetical protein
MISGYKISFRNIKGKIISEDLGIERRILKGKMKPRRPRHRCKENIKMYIGQMVCEGVGCTEMNRLNIESNSGLL